MDQELKKLMSIENSIDSVSSNLMALKNQIEY